MSLDSIVKVNISRETAVPTQKGFGTGAFLSDNAVFSGRAKTYANYDEISEDILAGSKAKAFALKYFSQQTKAEKLHVLKKAEDRYWMAKITLDADFVTGNTFTGNINATALSVAFDTDHATTLGNLATAIAADDGIATATATGAREITITGDTYGEQSALTDLVISGGASQAGVTDVVTQYADTEDTIVNSLDAAVDEDNDWYCLALYTDIKADQELVAAWIETRVQLLALRSDEAGIIASSTTDIAAALEALNYERSFVVYSGDADNYPEAAYIGTNLPKPAGSITWSLKSVKGITADALTSAQKGHAHSKNANTYTEVAGVDVFENGTVASGEYIDVMRGSDYITSRMQERVFTQLTLSDKVPFTDAGIAVIENIMRAVLSDAVTREIILPDFEITVPEASSISAADKSARRLTGLEFQATLQGAVHRVILNGRLVL